MGMFNSYAHVGRCLECDTEVRSKPQTKWLDDRHRDLSMEHFTLGCEGYIDADPGLTLVRLPAEGEGLVAVDSWDMYCPHCALLYAPLLQFEVLEHDAQGYRVRLAATRFWAPRSMEDFGPVHWINAADDALWPRWWPDPSYDAPIRPVQGASSLEASMRNAVERYRCGPGDPVFRLLAILKQSSHRGLLPWAVRWSREGRDPLEVAWSASTNCAAMVQVLELLHGAELGAAAQRAAVAAETNDGAADAVRACAPTAPTLSALVLRMQQG